MAFDIYKNSDPKTLMKDMLGLQKSKLSYQHKLINDEHRKELDHHQSQHSKSLQMSNYIRIDNDTSKKKLLDQQYSKKFMQTLDRTCFDKSEIPLRYCSA